MCKYRNPYQFAYIDPAGKFRRLGTPIRSEEQMRSCVRNIPHIAAYESVYEFAEWNGGLINPKISKTARIDGVFIDFDDANDPIKAIRDAAEVAAYVGHSLINFSGQKGAHLFIRCRTVNIIPDLKGSVLRMFVNNLVDRLPEMDTIDWSVIGDTTRVKRIINSVHPDTKMHAIGLTEYELATITIDELHDLAANRRDDLVQVPEPSQWVSSELWDIEDQILTSRLTRLFERKQISERSYDTALGRLTSTTFRDRPGMYADIQAMEAEWRRILAKNLEGMASIGDGRTPEETWLLKVVEIFKVVQRMANIQPAGSMVSTSSSEQQARCHITHLMNDCGWTREQMHWIFSHADDYKRIKTERQINSLIGRS